MNYYTDPVSDHWSQLKKVDYASRYSVGVVNTQQYRIVSYSVAEPPLQGWSRSREPHHLFGKQKEKPCSCDKHDLTAMYKGKYVPKSSVAEPK